MKLAKLLTLLLLVLFSYACSDSGAGDDGSDGDKVGVCNSDSDCSKGEQCYLLTHTCEIFCFDNTDCPDERICTSEGICGSASICLFEEDCQAGQICVWDDAYNSKVCKTLVDGDGPDGDTVDGDTDSSEEDDVIDQKCPIINVKPALLKFGSVVVGENAERTFTITNDSNNNIPLIIYGIFYDKIRMTEEYVVDPDDLVSDDAFSIQRGETVSVNVRYSPIDGGIDVAKVEISSNACGGGYVEVELRSQYKGAAYISVTPDERNFGNVNLGDTALEQEFFICNTGDLDGNRVLSVTHIAPASGVWDNFKCVSPNCVTPQVPPLVISPGEMNCKSFVIRYNPQSLAESWAPHREEIMIFNDSDRLNERNLRIPVMGSAESSSLFIHPYPIDFGKVSIGEVRERMATLYNYSPNGITITLIEPAQDSGCEMFDLGEDAQALFGNMLNSGEFGAFTVKYAPTAVGKHSCNLYVHSSLDGQPISSFPMLGEARKANQPPVALVSRVSHQKPIEMIIEGIPAGDGSVYRFYGDTSYDPDTTDPTQPIAEYRWTVLQWPAESEEILRTTGSQGMNSYMKFDLPGTYKFQLEVKDLEGLWCLDPFVVEVRAVGDQGLWLVMDFTPGTPALTTFSIVDCDLGLRFQSSGQVCDDEHVNLNGTCYALQNAICNMPKISQGAAISGTREEINCSWLEDGNWIIEVELEEDCQSNSDWQTLVKCWGTHDPTVTVKMYDPKSYNLDPLFPPISTKLTYKGQSSSWRIRKANGQWKDAPTLIN